MDVAESRKCDILRRVKNGATATDLAGMDAIAFAACVEANMVDLSDAGDVTVTKWGKSYFTKSLRRNAGRMQVVGNRVDTDE